MKKTRAIRLIRELLLCSEFLLRHKRKPEDFTRVWIFTFPILLTIILRKSIKSIQLTLNEIVSLLPEHITSVSSAAYTKARQKIRHTAFIELNQKTVIDLTYASEYKTYHGRRLFAIDSSQVMLPDTTKNKKVFGSSPYKNQNEGSAGEHAFAYASVLYDVLNHIAVDAVLERIDTSEITIAQHHFSHLRKGDIVILDRGYASYETMVRIVSTRADFVIRCSRKGFAQARKMLQEKEPDSVLISLAISKRAIAKNRLQRNIPSELNVRFIRVKLSNGEIEILATSLIDEQEFPTKGFQQLYWRRWGIETFYGTIKTRLALENFTGTSTESVRQDFFATIFLSGLESLLTEDINEKLEHKETIHAQQVNNAVAFHAIKYRAFDILLGEQNPTQIVQERS